MSSQTEEIVVDRNQVSELHCIMPIANMCSIMEHGILSHHRARAHQHESCASEEVQARRADKDVGGRPLHDYVNLYFNARNAMMYALQHRHDELCVVRVDHTVIDLEG